MKQGQFDDYEARLGKPFAHEALMRELADLRDQFRAGLRDQLKIGLSEHPTEGATPVAELAERIRALRDANTVEVAPVRTGTRKTTRAEVPVPVPVPARIRANSVEKPVEVAEEPKAVEVKPGEPLPRPPQR